MGDYVTDRQKQAYEDYINGMKYADIAEKYDVSISAVKMWAARDWKDKNKDKSKVTKDKKTTKSQPRSKGGQPCNTNTVKHGAYSKIYDGVFDEDEKDLFETMECDPEKTYIDELKLYTIREFRLLQQIKVLNDGGDNLIMSATHSRKLEIVSKNQELSQTQTEVVADKVAKSDSLNKLEEVLTKIQAGKNKCASELAKIRKEKSDAGTNGAKWLAETLENNKYD